VLDALPLRSANLGAIAARSIAVPSYDRRRLSPRILHVGVGGFHRAHMARCTDKLASSGGDWGIRGVGLLPSDERMAEVLTSQDHLYTLIERDSDETQVSVVGSIVDYVLAARDGQLLSRLLSEPRVTILSLTITEAGYSVDRPNTTFEWIVSALERRLAGDAGPLTVLSCDNLPRNGETARRAVLQTAAHRSLSLVREIEASCTFPNSMVDRITPQTSDTDRQWLAGRGVADEWPVVCETFWQWVIEDNFAAGRPAWEDVGVLFSDRVHDWELYKLRMLNASHSCIAYLMALADVAYVDEAIAMPEVVAYLRQLLTSEVIPTLPKIPHYPAAGYADSVLHRLGNTAIRDQIARLCTDGTAKIPNFLLPTVEAQLERNGPLDCAALALAGWARYLEIVPAADRADDARGDEAARLARAASEDPSLFLELDIFSERIRTNQRFVEAFGRARGQLIRLGPIGAIAAVVALD
jgi:mannitol 2-dehydrogenase